MLEQILDYIHNYFETETVSGDFIIRNGEFDTSSWQWNPFDFETDRTDTPKVKLQNGQYFMVCGSVFNDGVYQFPATGLIDEAFTGEIRAMAVPPAVIALSREIQEWCGKYVNSPYQSESFGGYSYTKSSGSKGGSASWQDVFGSRLNRWRKIS